MNLNQEKQTRYALATSQQRQAADPNTSVWVEASAGTGKTKVLTDRVFRLLLSGVNPAKILCLTYTKAAAVNMSTRIADELAKWAVMPTPQLLQELRKLLGEQELSKQNQEEILAQARKLFATLLDTAGGMKIQTIHSFCQEILKRFPIEAKISPYFEVMDDRSAREALDDIKRKLLRKLEQEPNSQTAQALSFITNNISEFNFPKLMSNLTQNRNKIMLLLKKQQNLETLLTEIQNRLNIQNNKNEQDCLLEFFSNIDSAILLPILNDMQTTGSKTDVAKSIDLSLAIEHKNFINYSKGFLTGENKIRATFATKAIANKHPQLTDFATNEALRCLGFQDTLASYRLFASTKAILEVASELFSGYQDFKTQHSKMDYEDLIIITRNLLEDANVADWILFKLDGGIEHILIDEAQDTSPDQWAIVKALTNEFFYGKGSKEKASTVFVVGDRKQSIYSFQGADPKEFENMRQYFLAKNSKDISFKEINLDVSFRSTAAILDSVNHIFASPVAKQGVVEPDKQVKHLPSRLGEAGRVEIWPLIEADKRENVETWQPSVERIVKEATSTKLAKQIASKIYNLVNSGTILPSKGRPFAYKDFMILVQKRNALIEEIVRACKQIGVNIAGIDKIKLSEQLSVQDLLSLGKFCLLPTDDLSLAEVLKSPLFGLDDNQLFEVGYNRGNKSLFFMLSQKSQFVPIFEQLQSWLNKTDFLRPAEFYSEILNSFNARKKFITRMGIEAEDGLDEFMNLCLNFEQTHIPSLQEFINWMSIDDVEIKREQEQSDIDAVRIMTVHGSKGLQAPYVIMPDTGAMKNITKEAGLLIDEDALFYPL